MQHLQQNYTAAVSSLLQHRSPLAAVFANAGKTVAAHCMLTAVISVYVSCSGHIKCYKEQLEPRHSQGIIFKHLYFVKEGQIKSRS